MADSYIEVGERLQRQELAALAIDSARHMYLAVRSNPDCELVELRGITNAGQTVIEILVVELGNDAVPSQNKVGIRYRERLALMFHADSKRQPEVRALRADFPLVPHLNSVRAGDPASLCVYFEPWSAISRTWTAQQFISRIAWWFEHTARETLHRPDQPVEQVYFISKHELVLPPNFEKKREDKTLAITFDARRLRGNDGRVLVGQFSPINGATNPGKVLCVTLKLPAVTHGRIDVPSTLGELHDSQVAHGGSLAPELFAELCRLATGQGLIEVDTDTTLLVIDIPIARTPGAAPERVDRKGFLLGIGIGQLGVKGGAFTKQNGKYFTITLIGQNTTLPTSGDWRTVELERCEVIEPFTRTLARKANGIKTPGPKGTLAGVGALGSELANIWMRSGWGIWNRIDDDHIKPHNLARHIAYEKLVGAYKVDAVDVLENSLYSAEPRGKAIPLRAENFAEKEVAEAMDDVDLVVDATVAFEFPREFSARDTAARGVSVFLTPSGIGSVLLMEDASREYRLGFLESQYYRAVIEQPWGIHHLDGHLGHLWPGAGCRHPSSVMATDLVTVHAATLARQIRLRSQEPSAAIRVWHSDSVSSAVSVDEVVVAKPIVATRGSMKIIWDEQLQAKVRELRTQKMPKETGGILLGYFDLVLGQIHIVDAAPAPPDSIEESSGFTRGIVGVEEMIIDVKKRTGGIVSYVGEWHSHPPRVAANASGEDIVLLTHLARELHADGLPAVMLIVGGNACEWYTAHVIAPEELTAAVNNQD